MKDNKDLIIKIVTLVVFAITFIVGGIVKGNSDSDDITEEVSIQETDDVEGKQQSNYIEYYFRTDDLLYSHFEKHGTEMGFSNAKEYESAACDVINNPDALYKTEKEDGDYVYYIEDTNEFVVLSQDGYIRTYFNPTDGIDYYNRQ